MIKIKVLCPRSGSHRKVKKNDSKTLVPWLCSRSQPGIKVIIRDLRGAFVTYCNISCFNFFSSFYQGVVLLNLLETKVNLNCLLFSQRERESERERERERERESPKSNREGGGQVVRWCWVNFPSNLDGPIIFCLMYLFSLLSPSLGDGPI